MSFPENRDSQKIVSGLSRYFHTTTRYFYTFKTSCKLFPCFKRYRSQENSILQKIVKGYYDHLIRSYGTFIPKTQQTVFVIPEKMSSPKFRIFRELFDATTIIFLELVSNIGKHWVLARVWIQIFQTTLTKNFSLPTIKFSLRCSKSSKT